MLKYDFNQQIENLFMLCLFSVNRKFCLGENFQIDIIENLKLKWIRKL